MGLKIINADEPILVSTLTACFYAPPGLGKTSLGYSAKAPLLLDFDKGAYRSRNRRVTVQVDRWDDIEDIDSEALKDYSTVVIDTAGRALDMLTAHILANDPKAGRGGSLSINGFGVLKTKFIDWLKMVRRCGKDVILLAHSDEQKRGDEFVERLDITGGSKGEVYKSADVMGRIFMDGGKRFLTCSPSDCGFGKNPGQMETVEIPDFAENPNFLGDYLEEVKRRINSQTAKGAEAMKILSGWHDRVVAAVTAKDFDELVETATANSLPDHQKKMIMQYAEKAGLKFDTVSKTFKKGK